jgi:hypothetical protein
VRDARRDAERLQCADAADTEQQLLPDANAVVAAVKARGQLAILRQVAIDVETSREAIPGAWSA